MTNTVIILLYIVKDNGEPGKPVRFLLAGTGHG